MSLIFNGSTQLLTKRLLSISLLSPQKLSASIPCLFCSQINGVQYRKQHTTPVFGTWLPRTYDSLSKRKSNIITPLRKQSTTVCDETVSPNPAYTSIDKLQQQRTSTCIAMIHYAKRGESDRCLQHFLQLFESQGKLPSHNALHLLARTLYIKQHLSGFSLLHDTLLTYYKLNPLSRQQSRNLSYIYTMFINLIIQQPTNTEKRSSTFRKAQRLSGHPAASSPTSLTPPTPIMTMEKRTEIIIQLCQEMRDFGLTGSPVLYNSVLKFCVMKNDSAQARSLYMEMVKVFAPTKHTYNILLELARQQKDEELLLQVLDRLKLDGIVPDRPMVSTVMLAFCDNQQYRVAIDFVDQLARNAPHVMGVQYKSVLMNTLQRHYQQNKHQQYRQQPKQKQGSRWSQRQQELSPPSSTTTVHLHQKERYSCTAYGL